MKVIYNMINVAKLNAYKAFVAVADNAEWVKNHPMKKGGRNDFEWELLTELAHEIMAERIASDEVLRGRVSFILFLWCDWRLKLYLLYQLAIVVCHSSQFLMLKNYFCVIVTSYYFPFILIIYYFQFSFTFTVGEGPAVFWIRKKSSGGTSSTSGGRSSTSGGSSSSAKISGGIGSSSSRSSQSSNSQEEQVSTLPHSTLRRPYQAEVPSV
jgi:hypothetical protein